MLFDLTIISRKEAKISGLKRYFTGRPCKHGHITQRDVVNGTCIECTRDWARKNPERVKQYSYEYYHENREAILAKVKEYFATETGRATQKRTRDKNRDKRNARAQMVRNPEKEAQRWQEWYERIGREHIRLRRQTNLSARLANQLRCRLNMAIRGNANRAGSAVKDLGCSTEALRCHLESQFVFGMTWENWGIEWEVDHIKPLGLFDLTDRQQFLEACHYTNLQPLFVGDHRIKTTLDIQRIISTKRAVQKHAL